MSREPLSRVPVSPARHRFARVCRGLIASQLYPSTGNWSATLQAVTARWNYNHTRSWIDDVFATHYAHAPPNATRPFVALTVPIDAGLTADELRAMEVEAAEAR